VLRYTPAKLLKGAAACVSIMLKLVHWAKPLPYQLTLTSHAVLGVAIKDGSSMQTLQTA
jgi:hypothetical protein